MCLYGRIIRNPKYLANKKNNYNPPICEDRRLLYVTVGCGECIECRKQKQREWQIRLGQEIKHDKTGKFITLTFSEESLNKLNYNKDDPNNTATIATRAFLERWRKKFKKSVKHWFITELGHEGTERIHIHGIIFTNENKETIEEIWKYGFVDIGYDMGPRAINYIMKYITKVDNDHKWFKGKILTSRGIGKSYLNSTDKNLNTYNENGETKEYVRTSSGHKVALPKYYRNHIYTEEEREKLWQKKLDEKIMYVNGNTIKNVGSKEGEREIRKALEYARRRNKEAGYGDGSRKIKEYITKNGKIICK